MLIKYVNKLIKYFKAPRSVKIDSSTAYKILECDNTNYIMKYKELIAINHPDKGGSEYLTNLINASKDYISELNKEIY
ncbi:hypothetical protein A0H76_100 [Hepatospora eriocheir]|uniref:J domain-containing protein n=1 Tax=Hepatospora eriocheir TaxID=1081669 RepID=A0A1X0QJF5_9MICR|nr:hypothetical protein HERIO_1602 [Hepatospora eriocheir]ORD99824.1 hypothetical protein A0H76_100 [Hepatospora eriocheir]